MVSHVDKLENDDGTKTLEIPAGDYVPTPPPTMTPNMLPLVYGQGNRERMNDLLQTSLIDDIDDDSAENETLLPSAQTRYQRLKQVLDSSFPSSDNWEGLANELVTINPQKKGETMMSINAKTTIESDDTNENTNEQETENTDS